MNLRRLVGGFVLLLCLSVIAGAQQPATDEGTDAPDKASPLGVRQKRVERMMDEMERKFNRLAEALEQGGESDRAERLIKTLQQSKELLIQDRMAKITAMLNDAQLETATAQQQAIIDDLRLLIKMLLDDDNIEKLKEIDRLNRWREQIGELLKEQNAQLRESEKIANKDQTLADIAAQIRAIEKLIEKQTQVNENIKGARDQGIQAFPKVADRQHGVRKETEQVAKAIAEAAGQGEGEGSKDGSEGEPKDGAKDGAKGEPKDGSKDGAKDGSKDGSEGGSKDGSQGGSKAGSQGASEPGQKNLQKAAENQKSAENNLQKAKGGDAQKDGEKALEDLKAALDELKKEERRIASLPPEAFEDLAQKQDKTGEKTASLNEEMKKGDGGQGSGGESGEGGQKSPGQQQVQEAQQAMQRASGGLREQDPEGAARQQREAVRQLEKALQEIEKRLAQLREETQEEKLARLEQRFTEMLARQRVATNETQQLDKKREEGAPLRRAERLALAKLAGEEFELAEAAQEALDILIEDGTSVVFPRIVEGLQEDLRRTGQLLESQRTDAYTQEMQKEIESTLEELIDALRRQRKQKQGGGGGGGGGGEPPLLPNSAELKLLKAAQLRVNRLTKAFDANRPEGDLDEVLQNEINAIALRQLEIAVMTESILERQ